MKQARANVVYFRVRYCDTDQMKSYYNARVLEWFEWGRTEFLRALGKPYTQWEAQGVLLPVCETHIKFLGRAQYDDRLKMTTTATMAGRARLKCHCAIEHADSGEPVCAGYTIHAITDAEGRPIRPPSWVIDLVS